MKALCVFLVAGCVFAAILAGCSGSGNDVLGGGGPSPTKTVVVADYNNARVLLYNVPISTGQSANVVLGQANFTSSSQATTSSGFVDVNDAEADKAGNIWVADTDNNRILEFKPPFSNGMAATLVIGQATFTTGGAATTATGLRRPSGLTFDAAGDLWVVDESNDRVVEYTPPFSNGMAATLVLGQANLTSSGCTTTATGQCAPWEGIQFDASGNLFVSDQGNQRILEYKPPFSSGMAATVVIGQANFTSSGCATTQTGLCGPYGIRLDSSGNLWVGDEGNDRVVEFTPPFSNGMNANLVIGQANFTTASCAATATQTCRDSGIGFDSKGNMYVTDYQDNRTLFYAPPFSTGMAATMVLGQADLTSSTGATTATGQSGPENVSPIP